MSAKPPLCRSCSEPLSPSEAAAYGGGTCEVCWGTSFKPAPVVRRYAYVVPAGNDVPASPPLPKEKEPRSLFGRRRGR